MNPKRQPTRTNNPLLPTEEDAEKRTLALFLKRLRTRDAFEKELRDYARLKKCPPHAVESALNTLRAKKLVDDFRLARHLAEIWTETKLWAPARIANELSSRGATPEAIENALSYLPQEHITARKLLKKLRKLPPTTLARRLASYGYSEECIQETLNPFFSDW